MKHRTQIPFQLTAISALVLLASGVVAQTEEESAQQSAYSPLLVKSQISSTAAHSAGSVELGLGYTSDDNYMFGQYNGLHEDGATLIGNLSWQDFSNSNSHWRASVSDLGLDTREGELIWGRSDDLKVTVGFDSQIQVRNNSGETPFRGSSSLQLPDNWETGSTTSDFGQLDASLRQFDRELQRDTLFAGVDAKITIAGAWTPNCPMKRKTAPATPPVASTWMPPLPTPLSCPCLSIIAPQSWTSA